MTAICLLPLVGLLAAPAALAWGQFAAGEVEGFPGEGRVTWKAVDPERVPLRLVKASHVPGRLLVKLVFELTRDLETDEVFFLEGRYGGTADSRLPISTVLLDADGVPITVLRGEYEGLTGTGRKGNRFRVLLQIPREAWDRTATVQMEWTIPRPPLLAAPPPVKEGKGP
jgi:hypothetical protein